MTDNEVIARRINNYEFSRDSCDENRYFVKSIFDSVPECDKQLFLDYMASKLRALFVVCGKDPETAAEKGSDELYRAAAVYADTSISYRTRRTRRY